MTREQIIKAIKDGKAKEIDLTGANLTGANLRGANLSGANLTKADLTKANLTEANLTEANLIMANLIRANLIRANLAGANLSMANLAGANLSGANLTDANLTDANLTEADLTEANLTEADLTEADLIRANLIRANLSMANLAGADLSGIKGLLSSSEWIRAQVRKGELLKTTKGLVCYRRIGEDTPYNNPNFKARVGAIWTETINSNRTETCGCGINVATLKWATENYCTAQLWKVLVALEDLAGACIPYQTDGKFRVERIQLLGKVVEKPKKK
jgi:hypothetical protein